MGRHGNKTTTAAPPQVQALEPRILWCGSGTGEGTPVPALHAALHARAHSRFSAHAAPRRPVAATAANVPQLHSDPSAPATLYLDFSGASATTWDGMNVPPTQPYDEDGKPGTFTAQELSDINQIWARVAEKFSPFNLDVTTVNPGNDLPGKTLRVVIGGNGAWAGGTYGGYSVVGGFAISPNPTSWIFPFNLANGDPHDTAEAISHEAGHSFGLDHQSVYGGTTLMNEYNSGNGLIAPVMGNSYGAARGLWWDGTSSDGSDVIQDDMAVIAGGTNGFGFRPQDHGQTPDTADPLALSGKKPSASGVIATISDTDFFSFQTTTKSTVSFTAAVAAFGPTLHLKLLLTDSAGQVITSADGATLGQAISTTIAAGSYRVEVASHGDYGDVGQYTLTGLILPIAHAAHRRIVRNAHVARAHASFSDRLI